MRVSRTIPVLMFAAAAVVACGGPSKNELEVANSLRADSVASLRNQLFEQMTEGTRFVDEINKELAKARSLGASRQLRSTAELVDANEERKQVVARIAQLVERLDLVQGRLTGVRTQLAHKDSVLTARVAEYDQMVADMQRQRVELQAVIDDQTTRIVTLSAQVDTLTGALGQLTAEHNAVYYVVGTKSELLDKGVLVTEGRRRFLLAGSKPVAPARELDPTVFTRIDRLSDTTIVLPDGVYKIVSRQNGAYVIPEQFKDGKIAGALMIEQPERFWSTSRFLIIMRS